VAEPVDEMVEVSCVTLVALKGGTGEDELEVDVEVDVLEVEVVIAIVNG
jgi:hypothetical protein